MTIPTVLLEIRDYICANPVQMTSADDGRVASAINEKIVVDKIREHFSSVQEQPSTRHWWDFAVEENDEFYPVNIKLTGERATTDNMNCKLGLYYALTGDIPNFANETPWDAFFSRLVENIRENDKDYYFFVVNKINNDVFVQGLKTLQTLTPNGNNLPFQCHWESNRDLQPRNFTDARKFLLSALGQSVSLRRNIYIDFHRHFPQYLEPDTA